MKKIVTFLHLDSLQTTPSHPYISIVADAKARAMGSADAKALTEAEAKEEANDSTNQPSIQNEADEPANKKAEINKVQRGVGRFVKR